MLNQLRSAAGTWVAKLLLILLVLSFAVWGISGQIMGVSGNTVLAAGDTEVSILEYRLAYDRQLARLSQQFNTRITREQAQAFGVDNQVLAQLAAGAVLDEQAREMQLGVSSDRLARLTAEDPAFQGPGGGFNRQQFEFVLSQVGMSPEDYLRNREQVAVRQQIVEAVSDGLTVPDTFLRAVALYQGEDRTIDYLVLPRSLVEPIEPPSEEELTAYFEENKEAYVAPEYRTISYVKLEPSDIADPATISDQQVRDYYEANMVRYAIPAERTIEQIVFDTAEAAEAARAEIAGGATFEDIVAAQGLTMADVQLGTFQEGRVGDPAIAEAAFALEQGEVSEVVQGSFGPVLLRVTDIQPESVQPLEEVEDEIRRELALDEAHRVIMDVYAAYEDARAAGGTMQEAAAAQGLEVTTVEVDRSGRTPDGEALTDLPEQATLLEAAFATEAGIENPPLDTQIGGFLFYEVDEITPSRERALEEVRDQVIADWTEQQVATRLAERAAEIEQQVADGAALTEIAAELGLEVQTKRGLQRDTNDADLGRAGVAAVFGVAEGETGVVPAPAGDARIVFEVTEVREPAAAGPEAIPEQTREVFASGLADDLFDQLVAQLRQEYPVTVNRGAIDRALSF